MAVVMAPEPVPAYLPASMGEHDGFSGKFEKKALTPTRSRGTLGEAYAQKARCVFLSSVSVWAAPNALHSAASTSPGFNSTACITTTERAFNSTVLLLGSPHALQTKGSQ